MGMRYVGVQPVPKRSKRHEAARQEALQMARSPYTPVGLFCGVAIMGDISWAWPLWAFIWATLYTIVKFLVVNYRSHDPERVEALERRWWMSDKELASPPGEIDWDEFGDAVELRLLEADDAWAKIDTADMIYKAERDMAYVWPAGAVWACPNCTHRFNRPMDQCPLCDHVTTEEERVPATAITPVSNDYDHKGWRCQACKKLVPATMHVCSHCHQGYRGGGPYRQEVFDGPDGPVLETIHEDPRTGDRTIVSSRKLDSDEYEIATVAEGGEEHIIPVGTSSHEWAGGTDLSSQAIGLFQVPPHMLGPGKPEDFHIVSSTRSRAEERHLRLSNELAKAVRSRQITYEQAQDAMQRLREYS